MRYYYLSKILIEKVETLGPGNKRYTQKRGAENPSESWRNDDNHHSRMVPGTKELPDDLDD